MSPFAGFVGCAVSLRAWCHQVLDPTVPVPAVKVSTKQELVDEIRQMVEEVKAQVNKGMCVIHLGTKV
jgi:hypothetical protein